MKRLLVFWSIALLGLTLSAAPVQRPISVEQTSELEPARDATLIESPRGSLGSSTAETLFVGRTGQAENGTRRALVAFDLSKIPPRSRISSVTLTMAVRISASGSQPKTVRLYRVLKSWGEGTTASEGARGAQAESGDPTWIHSIHPTQRWSHPGGDYSRVLSATQEVGGPGAYTWNSTPELVADVQSWLKSPKGNFGWILIGDESQAATAKVFKSRESTEEATRPHLAVTFRPPAK